MKRAMSVSLNTELRNELVEYIEDLTTSGQATLNEVTMKKVKKICRQCDVYVKEAFHVLMIQLEKPHAEIRRSAFQIMDELFNRSHCFRDLLIADFQNFLDLTAEIDFDCPLPPPKAAARELRVQVLGAIHRWNTKFAAGYKKLSLGYNYLKTCKKIDFIDIQAQSLASRQREEERRQRQETLNREKVEAAISELTETAHEVQDCLTQINNCFGLLFPAPDEFDVDGDEESTDLSQEIPTTMNGQSKDESPSTNTDNVNVQETSPSQEKLPSHETSSHQETSPSLETSPCQEKSPSQEISPCQKVPCSTCGNSNNLQNPTDSNSSLADVRTGYVLSDEESSDNDSDFYETEDAVCHSDTVRQHGLGSHTYSLTIELTEKARTLEETVDNTDVLNALKDLNRLLTHKCRHSVNKCLEVFTKSGGRESYIKKAIDTKESIDEAQTKFANLNIILLPKKEMKDAQSESEDDDNDFIEVAEKEGYEETIPEYLREEFDVIEKPIVSRTDPEWSSKDLTSKEKMQDPLTWAANRARLLGADSSTLPTPSQPSTSKGHSTVLTENQKKKTKLLEEAPVVQFGKDLFYNWEDPAAKPPELTKFDSLHLFWTPRENEVTLAQDDFESLKTRSIVFAGKFEPVKWSCRAPLKSGKLCPRMDREKCPFHGKVIGRNRQGGPTDPDDVERLKKLQKKKEIEVPPWKDPELHRQIKEATGIDLSVKKGKGRKKKHPNLTDISKTLNTARTRLGKKVLSKKSLKRVAMAMGVADAKRFKDKFGNQFNYSLKSS